MECPDRPLNPCGEPIAVVGIGCRLPGARNTAELWSLLRSGTCTITDIPPDRFDAVPDPEPQPGRIVSSRGGFIPHVRDFDAQFFGVSPREAVRTDPRHRLLLETSWEALEDAGLPAERLAGTTTAVYASGAPVSEYWDLVRQAGLPDLHSAFGAGMFGSAAGRLSRLLDARGPSMSIDATCASSLLAVHLAIRSLRSGESDAALVTGVNLILTPDYSVALSSGGVLSPDGLCRFGDAGANGYVRSEGVVAVLLKRLSDAVTAGDRIQATLLGSGTSNDGRTAESPMSPSATGQEAALRAAYRDAGVPAAQVDYVEAHGTGTAIGDRIELTALARVLGERREPDRPCRIGSVKSNIGHTEATAGLAGLVKAVLAVRHRTIPATLHVTELNPTLATEPALALAQAEQPWPTGKRPVAGVSSFGLSGVNVHVVVSDAPGTAEPVLRPGGGAVLVPVSARSGPALRDFALQCAQTPVDPVDLAHSAGLRRTHHGVRAAVVARDPAELARGLRAVTAEEPTVTGRPSVVFVFSGQGSQWTGMAHELLQINPVFSRTMTECDAAIDAELGWSVMARLLDREPMSAVDVVQPSLWAIQVSLAALWRDWGIEPDLLIGHSMGEVGAATVSGALTIRQGAAVICRRARLLRNLTGGAMAAVHLGEQEALQVSAGHADRVSVGVVNSSHATVLSGDADAVGEVLAETRRRGVFGRLINVDYASHSPHVDAVRERLAAELAGLAPRAGTMSIHSTTRDRVVPGSEFDADYWMDNLRQPVHFASAVRASLAEDPHRLFVELSPHPVLVDPIKDEIEASGGSASAVGSLQRHESWTALLHALGFAYTRGCAPRWERVNPPGRFRPLPRYPWQRKRHWTEPATTRVVQREPAVSPPAAVVMREHADPADAWLDTVLDTAQDVVGERDTVLEGVRQQADHRGAVRVALRPITTDLWSFEVLGKDEEAAAGTSPRWTAVATGRCRAAEPVDRPPTSLDAVRRWCSETHPDSAALRRLWRRDGEAIAELGARGSQAFCVDALVAALPTPAGDTVTLDGIDEARFHGPISAGLLSHTRLTDVGEVVHGDVRVLDHTGRVVADLRGVRLRTTTHQTAPARSQPEPTGTVEDYLTCAIAQVLQTRRGELDRDTPLGLFGLDSLLAAELRVRVKRDLGVDLPVRLLLGGGSVAALTRTVSDRSLSRQGAPTR